MNAWRGSTEMPGRWARRSASILRVVCSAGATVRHLAVDLAVVRMHCLIVGHDDGVAREPNRLFLRCGECGRSTRGWAIASSVPRVAGQLPGQNAQTRAVHSDRSRHSSPTLRMLRKEPDAAGRVS